MRRLFIATAVFLMSQAVFPQHVTVSALPDTTVLLIGDQTGLTVRATMPSDIRADLKTLSDTLAGKVVVLRREPRDTVSSTDGSMTIIDRYLITSFDTGTYIIPPFYAELTEGDSVLRYYSDASFLRVLRPDITPPDSTDVIFDIVPPRGAPVTFAEILPWLVIAAIAAVVLYLLARFLPRNPLRRFVRPPKPPEPAHVIALRELQALQAEELWQKGQIKDYYSRLSDIMRRYIDNRYGISSPELTTDETVRMLQKASVTTRDQMTLVKELLSLSDMVKFAKYLPEAASHESTYAEAVMFVEETKVVEVTPQEETRKGGKDA